jgi:hypothetical protein
MSYGTTIICLTEESYKKVDQDVSKGSKDTRRIPFRPSCKLKKHEINKSKSKFLNKFIVSIMPIYDPN